ncbi:MAG TPA: ribonuclease III family protein [Candidatus Lokiarchaeia archaeon]|nr:ribonuclease III family protein [Candidatus Lokiarchaeia archaeon]
MDFLKVPNLEEAIKSRAYYKLGDCIANLVYSMAKAKVALALHGRLDIEGTPKVSARILKDAIAKANVKAGANISKRGGAHEIADVAEAILAYGWVNEIVELEECAELIATPVIAKKPVKLHDEWESFAEGFSDVLAKILMQS